MNKDFYEIKTSLSTIKSSLQKGDLQTTVSQLLEYTKSKSPHFYQEVILHSARFHQLHTDERKGIIRGDEFRREKSTLINALLDLITELEEELSSDEPILSETRRYETSPQYRKEIYISYSWSNSDIVDAIDKKFNAKGITVRLDTRDVGYKKNIKSFMENLGRGKCIIVVITDKYLKSANCMFELVQIAKNGKLYDRIFPIVLEDAGIYNPIECIKYIKYWEDKIDELDKAMKSVSSAYLQGFREKIDQYTDIRNTISEIIRIISNMNTITPHIHRRSGFRDLIREVERKIAE